MLWFTIILSLFQLSNCFQARNDPSVIDNRGVLVHLFEWKWVDIANECERFLAPKGFSGVQISPPQEHPFIIDLANGIFRPWYERYQPVSYKLVSRSGTEEEFINMVQRCNAVGVRIMVDASLNHMCRGNGVGSAGSKFWGNNETVLAVPYGPDNFHDKTECPTFDQLIHDWHNPVEVRNCRYNGLLDLKTDTDYVKNKLIEYLNHLISIGVAGFRFDAAKHMPPKDIENILNGLKRLREDVFGKDKLPFVYSEVVEYDSNDRIKSIDYSYLGRVLEYRYGEKLSLVVRKQDTLKWIPYFGMGWSFLPDNAAVVFVDNHNTQRYNDQVLSFSDPIRYKIAVSFMLAWPYGLPNLMSSYKFTDKSQSPPFEGNGITKDVTINSDGTCGDGWVCEHRWREITNMVKFRKVADLEPVQNWWDNSNNQIAFSRGSRAFIAINNDEWLLDAKLQTGLPAGKYCDVNSGDKVDGVCTGQTITVKSDGTAQISIPPGPNPIIAIHVESKL